MNEDCLKPTTYFGDADGTNGGFLAEVLTDVQTPASAGRARADDASGPAETAAHLAEGMRRLRERPIRS